jgi:hypothetical protein
MKKKKKKKKKKKCISTMLEDVLGSGGITPRILDLGTRWR